MIPSEIDFRLYQNFQKTKKFIVYQSDGTTPHDMSGNTVKLYFKPEGSSDPFTEITGSVGGANNNEVTFVFTTTHTANVSFNQYKIVEEATPDNPLIIGNINIEMLNINKWKY